MRMRATFALVVALAGSISASAAGEYYLYTPRQIEAPSIPDNPTDGVLVTTVTVRRGDTLTKLARKYGGRGSYFPQILLFNRIGNPDLIYAGDQLRIPVSRPAALSFPAEGKREGTGGAARPARAQIQERTAPAKGRAVRSPDVAGQRLFDKAVASYEKGDYLQALDAFELFLKEYPDSPLAADAALYRAECYLQMAGRQQMPVQ